MVQVQPKSQVNTNLRGGKSDTLSNSGFGVFGGKKQTQ